MTLSTSVTLLDDASFTITGTNVTFVNDGRGVNGTKTLVDSTPGVAILLRRKVNVRVRLPANAPNDKAKATLGGVDVVVHTPFVDSKGKEYKQPDTFSLTYHPEMTEAQIIKKRKFLCALIMDGEFDNVVNRGIAD